MTSKGVPRREIGFPIVDKDAGAAAALLAMRAYHIGGAAVSVGGRYALVRAKDILDSVPMDKTLAEIAEGVSDDPAEKRSFPAAVSNRLAGGQIFVDPKDVQLALFEMPAAYKQCTVNHNHTFDADLDADKCPLNDNGDLILVF